MDTWIHPPKMWDAITHPYPNFNDELTHCCLILDGTWPHESGGQRVNKSAVEVRKRKPIYIPQNELAIINHACPIRSQTMSVKVAFGAFQQLSGRYWLLLGDLLVLSVWLACFIPDWSRLCCGFPCLSLIPPRRAGLLVASPRTSIRWMNSSGWLQCY